MTSPPAGSVSSKFSTVRFNSLPSLRLITTTLILSATLLQPDIAFQLTHGKHQGAFSSREPRQESLTAEMTEREARGVKMTHRECFAGRLFCQNVQRPSPNATEPIPLGDKVQESPVGGPSRVPL